MSANIRKFNLFAIVCDENLNLLHMGIQLLFWTEPGPGVVLVVLVVWKWLVCILYWQQGHFGPSTNVARSMKHYFV